ncbi:MAG: hypothetical protein U5O69_01420 [Candidatus Competibacteraceae bacterium]|nr:hypothetical protein [Candidatus Competibacteraceae bacterium]
MKIKIPLLNDIEALIVLYTPHRLKPPMGVLSHALATLIVSGLIAPAALGATTRCAASGSDGHFRHAGDYAGDL